MQPVAHIAIVGEFDPAKTAHRAIPVALALAADKLGGTVEHEWVATDDLTSHVEVRLAPFDAIWCAPGSPYVAMDGALNAIRFARERDRAYLGTCGGYQHALIEYARNVMELHDADHGECNPHTPTPLIAALRCAMIEASAPVHIDADSPLARILPERMVTGEYHCSYGLNPAYAHLFESGPLRIVARNAAGDAQAIALQGHRFFTGVAFQPERDALRGQLSPIVTAFVRAAQEHHL